MEIDTGAQTLFHNLKKKSVMLGWNRQKIKLCQYDGTPLPVKGEIEVKVQKEQQTMTESFVLISNGNTSCHCLDGTGYANCSWTGQSYYKWQKQGQSTNWRFNQSKKFADVFKEELGLLMGLEAEIELKEGTSPKFCKSRPISFVLCTSIIGIMKKGSWWWTTTSGPERMGNAYSCGNQVGWEALDMCWLQGYN